MCNFNPILHAPIKMCIVRIKINIYWLISHKIDSMDKESILKKNANNLQGHD